MKAYILSREHGVVQIGHTVYQPCTGARINADRKGLKGLTTIEVKTSSMASARVALKVI